MVACAATQVPIRPAFGTWTRTAVTWAKDQVTHPMAQVGPRRGVAFTALGFATSSTIWADQPAHAAKLRTLYQALVQARPVQRR